MEPNSTMDDGFAPKRSPKSSKKTTATTAKRNQTITVAMAGVIIAAIGFASGMFYQKGQSNGGTGLASANGQSGGFGQTDGSGRQGAMRRMGVFGTVSAISDSSITVGDQRSGESTTYAINSTTTITDNGTSASASDIKSGDTVMISTATSGTDSTTTDSKTATAITLNPSMGNGPMMQGAPTSSSDSSSSSI